MKAIKKLVEVEKDKSVTLKSLPFNGCSPLMKEG